MNRSNIYKVFSNKTTHIVILALLPNLLILRASIPYLEYLFIILNILYIPIILRYISIDKLRYFKYKLRILFKTFLPYVLISITFILSFIFSPLKSFLVLRQLLICIYFLYYIIIFFLVLDNESDLKKYVDRWKEEFIIITLFAGSLGILKLIFELAGIRFGVLYLNDYYPFGSSLKLDHNFFSLCLLIGLVFFIENMNCFKLNRLKLFLGFSIYSFAIFYSSSRRGVIFLIIITIYSVSQAIFKQNKEYRRNLSRITSYFVLLFLSIITLSYLSLKHLPIKEFDLKQRTTSLLYDYSSIFSNKTSFNSIYYSLWKRNYMADWRENNIEKSVKMKKFIENQPVPLIFSSEYFSLEHIEVHSDWNLYLASYIENQHIEGNDILIIEGYESDAGIYKYINFEESPDTLYFYFNYYSDSWSPDTKLELRWADQVRFYPLKNSLKEKKWQYFSTELEWNDNSTLQILFRVPGQSPEKCSRLFLNDIAISSYKKDIQPNEDINNISVICNKTIYNEPSEIELDPDKWYHNGNIKFDKYYSEDKTYFYTHVDSLQGSIYKDVIIPVSHFWHFSADALIYSANRNLRIEMINFSRNNYCGRRQNNINMNNRLRWQHLESIMYAKKGDSIRISVKHFNDPQNQLALWNNIKLTTYSGMDLIDTTNNEKQSIPVEDSVLAFISKSEFIKEKQAENKNKSLYPRITRWKYAFTIFKDYSLDKKITGSGFTYLEDYKNEFAENDLTFDYPHNVFISAMLYSGIVGLALLTWLMIDITIRYIRTKSIFSIFIWFMILLFVLISSDSIFELPLLTYFIIKPLLNKVPI